MSAELTSNGKLTKTVTYHVLCTENWDKVLTVVYSEGKTYKFWRDNTGAGPSTNDTFRIRTACVIHFLEDARVNIIPFLETS